ncbi:hypothetical protein NPIL_651061 [Nephila pilipes]|uniref:Uncharacterized protein n=1 Tax=Nephila pilipes TaxID=299642 RepID=A0A8X6U888_NEPPI|nr:hypothetical protein NPIL_651061 [Nephila pilipes]
MQGKVDTIRQPTAFRSVTGQKRSTKILPQTESASKEGYHYSLVVGKWNHLESGEIITSKKYYQEIGKMYQKTAKFMTIIDQLKRMNSSP